MHAELEIALVTHVDDFLIAGPEDNLNWARLELKKIYEITGHMIGETDMKNQPRDRRGEVPRENYSS